MKNLGEASSAEPLVVAVLTPFGEPNNELQDLLHAQVNHLEVHFTPYNESREMRASRGANAGREPTGLARPEVSDEMRAVWARAHVMVGIDLPDDIASVAPNLRWFQAVSAGVDQIDQASLAGAGVRLASANGIASGSIAEFVMARLLEVWKHLRQFENQQQQQVWIENFGTEVAGRTLLVAGLGSIGRELARRARAFDMRVIATRQSAKPGDVDADVDELHPASDLDVLLPMADAVVCCLPTNPNTIDLFNADRFDLMKDDAIFCNVGRGTLVVEEDLVATLERGHLRAAILDVMRAEPVPSGDPLWNAPRMYLSPHSAVSADRYQQNAWKLVDGNLRRFLAGDQLHNEVDVNAL